MTDLCGKCGKEPRVPGQRWCRACRAESKRVARAGNKVGNAPGNTGNGERVGNACPTCAERAKRIEVLEADVAALKRQLAERASGGGHHHGTHVPANPKAALVVRRAAGAALCVHGSAHCQALACRMGVA